MAEQVRVGGYVVYHRDDAGSPAAHLGVENADGTGHGGPWFFQPVDDGSGEVFSPGYATKEAAASAAERWDAENAADEEN